MDRVTSYEYSRSRRYTEFKHTLDNGKCTEDIFQTKPTSIVTLCICMPTSGRTAGLARLALTPHPVVAAAARTAGAPWMTNPAMQHRSQTNKRNIGLSKTLNAVLFNYQYSKDSIHVR